ncbi:phage tail spike protein [Bacillus thuringiensis]|uniref:phage tail spike protein n=1 Tax=Bacillus thuringiensis TaxID=1428 RepID=UPI0016430B2A|nr:phage tail spike protein [Bacillus thuringiensis]
MITTDKLPYVTDLQGNTEAFTDFIDFKRYRRVNGDRYISFMIFDTPGNAYTSSDAFNMIAEESIIGADENEYRVKTCEKRVIGDIPVKIVTAIHTFFDLIDQYVYDTVTNTQSLQQIASFIFKDTKYTPIVLANVPNQVFEAFGNGNVINLLNKALDVYGVEFEVVGTQVIFKNQIGNKTDFQFRRKYNIKDIKETIDTKGLSTYIRGYGKDNLFAVYTSPNATKFGLRHANPVRDERFTVYENLLAEMKKRLNDKPNVTIELEITDLKKLGFNYDVISLGDSGFVIHEVLNIDYEARIIEYVDYPFEQTKNSSIVIGNLKKSTSSFVSDLQADNESIKGELNGVKSDVDELLQGIPDKLLSESIRRASKAINDSMTELEYPESGGIIARSKVNPNFIVRLTSGGIGVSADGGKTYKTAMTGEGLVAELIRGGVITGSTLRTDNGSNYVHIQKQFIRLMESNLTRVFLGYYTNSINQLQPTIVLGGDDKFQDGSVVLSQQPTQGFLGTVKGKDANGDPKFVSYISLGKDGTTRLKSDSLMSFESAAGLSATIANGSYWVEATGGIALKGGAKSVSLDSQSAIVFNLNGKNMLDVVATPNNETDLRFQTVTLRNGSVDGYTTLQVKNGSGSAYNAVTASAFQTASKREYKTNIRDLQFSALEKIMALNVQQYNLKTDMEDLYEKRMNRTEDDPILTTNDIETHYGWIADDENTPGCFVTKSRTAAEIYSSLAIQIRAFQEEKIAKDNEISDLKAEIEELKEKDKNHEERLAALEQKLA